MKASSTELPEVFLLEPRVFSDDRGATWRCGENVPGAHLPDPKLGQRSQINEVQMAELNDGSVRLNSRQFAGAKVRKTSVSRDGGATWTKTAVGAPTETLGQNGLLVGAALGESLYYETTPTLTTAAGAMEIGRAHV